MIEIKSLSGAVLYIAKDATDVRTALQEAVAARADLAGAYLADAYLAGAYLADAYLADAYLADANLAGANLAGANLAGANLAGAYGLNPYLSTSLHILADQVGKIRAYKLVDANGGSPIHSKRLAYVKGETVECRDADTDPAKQCAAGINVATLDWCIREWRPGWRVLVVEFTAADIAAIPNGSDGEFRVHRVKVVGEKDLVALGVVQAEAVPA